MNWILYYLKDWKMNAKLKTHGFNALTGGGTSLIVLGLFIYFTEYFIPVKKSKALNETGNNAGNQMSFVSPKPNDIIISSHKHVEVIELKKDFESFQLEQTAIKRDVSGIKTKLDDMEMDKKYKSIIDKLEEIAQ